MSQYFQRGRLGAPYDDMVSRVHERVLELLGAAERGDRVAAQACVSRLLCQASALEELLIMVINGKNAGCRD